MHRLFVHPPNRARYPSTTRDSASLDLKIPVPDDSHDGRWPRGGVVGQTWGKACVTTNLLQSLGAHSGLAVRCPLILGAPLSRISTCDPPNDPTPGFSPSRPLKPFAPIPWTDSPPEVPAQSSIHFARQHHGTYRRSEIIDLPAPDAFRRCPRLEEENRQRLPPRHK